MIHSQQQVFRLLPTYLCPAEIRFFKKKSSAEDKVALSVHRFIVRHRPFIIRAPVSQLIIQSFGDIISILQWAPLFQKNAFDYITLLDDYHVSAHPFQVLPLILIIYSAVYHSISMKQILFCSGDSILSKVFWVQSHASDRSTAKKI